MESTREGPMWVNMRLRGVSDRDSNAADRSGESNARVSRGAPQEADQGSDPSLSRSAASGPEGTAPGPRVRSPPRGSPARQEASRAPAGEQGGGAAAPSPAEVRDRALERGIRARGRRRRGGDGAARWPRRGG